MKRETDAGRVTAIIPAAGSGLRMRGKVPKQFLLLDGLPILAHTLKVFETAFRIDHVVLVVPEPQLSFCRTEIVEKYGLRKVSSMIPGGERRQDSVYEGLKALPAGTEWVVIHDGVRPFVTEGMIESAVQAAQTSKDGAVVAIPMRDTPKEVSPDAPAEQPRRIVKTLDRQKLWLAQTPQVFRKSLILKAHEEAQSHGIYGTDDAALVERLGESLPVVLGSDENIKVTTPTDLHLAHAILAARHTGGRTYGRQAGRSKKSCT
jgi:2-C-methyl-D-erythritol 4-phosphate cytidylyltransferase